MKDNQFPMKKCPKCTKYMHACNIRDHRLVCGWGPAGRQVVMASGVA